MIDNKSSSFEEIVFAPGCALMLYKPELAGKIFSILNENLGKMAELSTCCHHDPQFAEPTKVINVCPGCDKRFENDYKYSSTISLWEILAQNDFFTFPDYYGQSMTIMDACPTRDKENVQNAIRKLLHKMNINLIEPKNTGSKSVCCGDSFYDVISKEKVIEQMKKRISDMPVEDVVVYCVSCIKSVYIGGKKPRYLIDLLFANESDPKTYEPDAWHAELNEYMEQH